MKKSVLLLLAIVVLAWAAWLMNGPSPVQADDVPEKYQGTIQKGLEYLAKKQSKDGHWEGDGGAHPVAMTGLVGLALLMSREKPWPAIPTNRRLRSYSLEVRRAAEWLIDKSGPERDGLIFSGHESERSRYMQGHGLATILLAGVLQGETESETARNKKLMDTLTRAIKYIARAQSSQGGWYDTSKTEGHDFDSIQATVIQFQALEAALNAGIPVPDPVIRDGKEYLQSALDKADKLKKPGNTKLAADAAAALAGIVSTHSKRADRSEQDYWRERWEKFCRGELPTGNATKFGRDELAHCYFAEEQAMIGGESWTAYREALFDALHARQNKDGSWPTGDGISVGPVYSTAVWCIVLQLDRKSHPSIQQIEFATR
jgi:hypothetical protein